ncbi:RdgB/HAM1 family non-canonical purine NTP pyrophosphatase [Paenibacillus nasutitermitis]|uniref:dITP/XTP pyrophosphatase n=1 Tax=Paenibacillus nasutitermitis TaxID=1652958 RepID=A0A917DNP7_9BACL|nr:RdgB/HAM1 family non-canonical purine NTP pyrophosphatase [Paenibacillus nasutitermitis]GGD54371.1 hypothetical protein GCM10010911_09930 [Paenibacillus nasutitermitis]
MTAGGTVVVATKNAGKVREFAHAFGKMGLQVVSMFDYPDLPDIVEDGATFSENARKKAKTVAEALHMMVLADDSGLEVEALGGRPGIYSARYAGESASDALNNAKLLDELALEGAAVQRDTVQGSIPQNDSLLLSKARFVCALALYNPSSGSFVEAEGTVEGFITDTPSGAGGFGYDPLFWLASHGRTMAELSKDEKQAISHRGQALASLLIQLENAQ